MSEDSATYGTNSTPDKMNAWLKESVKEIRGAIELEADNTNPAECLEKLKRLSSLTANAAMCQSTAKKLLLLRQQELIKRLPDSLSPSLQVKWLQGELFEEESMQTYCDRLAAGLSNSIEAIRTIVSFTKSEMEQSKYQQG